MKVNADRMMGVAEEEKKRRWKLNGMGESLEGKGKNDSLKIQRQGATMGYRAQRGTC